MLMSHCPKCEHMLPRTHFYAGRNKDGLDSYCRECRKAQVRAAKAQPGRMKHYNRNNRQHLLKYTWGLTLEDWDEMLARQGGECANPACHADTSLQVDHCHETGQIRWLLCGGCNTALGMTREDPARLRGLAELLETLLPERCPTGQG
jgi:hypothetical protein